MIPFRFLVEESSKRDTTLKVTNRLAPVVEDATHVLLDNFVNILSVVVVDAELVLVTFSAVIDLELLNKKVKITVALPRVRENDGTTSIENVLAKMFEKGAALTIGNGNPVSATDVSTVRVNFSDGEKPDTEATRTSSFVILAVAEISFVNRDHSVATSFRITLFVSEDRVENSFRPILLGALLDVKEFASARERNTVADVSPQIEPGAEVVATISTAGFRLRWQDEGALRSVAVSTSGTKKVVSFLYFLLWTTGTSSRSRGDIGSRR